MIETREGLWIYKPLDESEWLTNLQSNVMWICVVMRTIVAHVMTICHFPSALQAHRRTRPLVCRSEVEDSAVVLLSAPSDGRSAERPADCPDLPAVPAADPSRERLAKQRWRSKRWRLEERNFQIFFRSSSACFVANIPEIALSHYTSCWM